MKEKPILFSGEMVRAIIAGHKTQTRRAVNMDQLRVRLPYTVRSDVPSFVLDLSGCKPARAGVHRAGMNQHGAVWAEPQKLGLRPGEFDFVCPYAVGTTRLINHTWHIEPHAEQRLWVKETFAIRGNEDGHPKDAAGALCEEQEAPRFYRADCKQTQYGMWELPDGSVFEGWRPSIFMPRWASRITLEVVSVRVERLQDISPFDACCEGVGFNNPLDPVQEYSELWESINGAGAWAKNPFVWVIDFRRLP